MALYILLMIAIHLPAVQSFMGRKAASVIAEELGTEVSIKHVGLGFLNRLILDDVLIYDQQQKEMVRVGRLSVKMEVLPLLEGRVSISSAQLFGAHLNLYKTDSLSAPNYQFALDSLASADSTSQSSLNLRINSLIVRHSSIHYDQHDASLSLGKFNSKHLHINNISAHVIMKCLQEDSININVKRLAFNEESGLAVNKLALRFEANNSQAQLEDFLLQMPHSTLTIDNTTASYDSERIGETLYFETGIHAIPLTVSELSSLLPTLGSFDQQLTIDAALKGSANVLQCSHLDITSDDHSLQLHASGHIENHNQQPAWNLHLNQFDVSNKFLAQFESVVKEMPEQLKKLNIISVKAVASGLGMKAFQTQGTISTDRGNLALQISMDSLQQFQGQANAEDIQLGTLLDNEDIGLLTADVEIKGSTDNFEANGLTKIIQYKGYTYRDVTINAAYKHGDIAGKVMIDDPNIHTDIEGGLTQGKKTAIRLTGNLKDIRPQALNLSERWGDSRFSAIINADFAANSINDAEGSININNFVMETTDSATTTCYRLDNLHVNSGYEDGIHFLKLKGDMGEADIRGSFDWSTLSQSLINYAASILPTMPGIPQKLQQTDNQFVARIKLTDTEWMNHLLGIPVDILSPITLQATIDDPSKQVNMKGRLPLFSYEDKRYRDALVDITTEKDTLKYNFDLTKEMDDGSVLDLNLNGQAADNQLLAQLRWRNDPPSGDSLLAMRGTINTTTQLYNNEKGKPEAQVRILPSRMMVRGTSWNLEPCDVLFTSDKLTVDHFALNHGDQHLIIDGIASASPTDSIVVDMNQLEVDYILDLVNFHSVSFEGLATGKAYAKQLFGDFSAWAQLQVDQFHFQEGHMGTLLADAEWNKEDKQIDIHAVANDVDDTHTYIDGYVSPTRNDINLDIRAEGTSLDFCNSFTDSFLRDLKGNAYGKVTLFGLLSDLNLTGQMVADGQATVNALNTTYYLNRDTITLVINDILFDHCIIKDRYGHEAQLTGGIHHDHLSDITFDMDVVADNLLAYDFPDFGDDIICGTVFATGTADLHGRPGEVTINCDVTPQPNTVFAYNATNPDAISQQEFITWGSKSEHSKGDTVTTVQPTESSSLASATNIYINFSINATPNGTLRVLMDANTGDYITLNGNGAIKATFYNKGPFHMFGTYSVERGTYGITIQNFIKKNFTFQNGGSIVFGGDPFNANLNLQALYTVNGVSLSDLNLGNSFSNNTVRVNCLMNILGTIGAPRVEFDLEMPTVNADEQQMVRSVINGQQEMNQQVLYLLGIGRFYTQGANNAQSQQYGQTELAMQSFLSGTVSSQISEVLSQVIKSEDWNFGANISTGNEGWHNAEYEGIINGRMLNNRLLINGQFGYRDNATQATTSFIGDFDIRYLLNPNGTLAIKAYNQTNDRYFTRSSLNTQGIGFIMKKEFDSIGDLFRHRKKR